MTRSDVLDRLTAMPDLLARALAAVAPERRRVRPPAGGFSLAEHAWHLADLEREGYATRLSRILAEDAPRLPDFDGDRAARERAYQSADPELGARLFADARAQTVARLAALPSPALLRRAHQEHVGEITLGQIPLMMAQHDQSHAAELADLLAHLGAAGDALDSLRAHAAAALPESPSAPSSRPAAA
jgi:uncharacterized damage-inducible protein DinB